MRASNLFKGIWYYIGIINTFINVMSKDEIYFSK